MRINKYLSARGIASRRKIDELIEQGRIKIDGRIAKVGDLINEKHEVFVDNKKVGDSEEKVYLILNKPKGFTSTVAKIKGEKNILELVKSKARLYPVGRLDKESSGLILLTNDGEITQKITHPKNHIPKTYEVKVLGGVTNEQVKKLEKGIKLEEGITQKARVKIKEKSLPHHTILEITIYEGKNRQIRRMLAELHLHVLELKRISIGSIKIGNLEYGKFRNLTGEEVKLLKS